MQLVVQDQKMVSHPGLFKSVSKALGVTYTHLKNTGSLQMKQ